MASSNQKPDTVHVNCPPAGGGPGTAADSCIEKWKQEKDVAKRDLDQKIAEVEQSKKKLENAIAWEAKLKLYYDNAAKTDELSDKVRRELEVMIAQVERICENSACTVEALKCLYFQVEEVFSISVSALLNILELLQKCIKCITDPALVRDKGITKAISDLEQKIKELDALHLDAIKKVIDALKCALILHYSLCEKTDEDEDYKGDALLCDLYDLLGSFGGPVQDSNAPAQQSKSGKSAKKDDTAWACSENDETLSPRPGFPIKSDDYYTKLATAYDNASQSKQTAKDEYDRLKKEKEAKQACFDSLTDAIDTADKTKNGK